MVNAHLSRFCVPLLVGTLAACRLCLGEAPASPPRIDADPTTAPVADPPPIVDPLDDAEYAKRSAAILRAAGPAPAAADSPTSGAGIKSVEPQSQADGQMLVVDDVIVAVDGKPTPNAASVTAAHHDATRMQIFDVVSCDHPGHRMVQMNPGPLGIEITDTWLLEGEYLRDLPAGVAPMDDLRVAARSIVHDPALAESALARARRIGGPASTGPAVDAIAAIALFEDDWFDAALAYATAAKAKLPQDCSNRFDELIAVSALATFRPAIADTIEGHGSDHFHQLISNAMDVANAFQLRPHTVPQPNPCAANLPFVDQTHNVVALPAEALGVINSDDTGSIRNSGSLPFSAPDAHYTSLECGPGDANVDFSAQCHFAASDNGNSQFDKVVRIGVAYRGARMKQFELYLRGFAVESRDSDSPEAQVSISRLIAGDRKFNIRMTVVGDRCELDIDGRRIFYGPMPAELADMDPKLTLVMQTVGVTGEFTNIHWRTFPRPQG
jgi:hypothetical protein